MKTTAATFKLSLCVISLLANWSASVRADDAALVGHWMLTGDAKDSSGQGNDGQNRGVDLGAPDPVDKSKTAAAFNGSNTFIQVPPKKSLNLGNSDFTLSVWIHTADNLDDAIGDLVSKFDPATRRGFNLCNKNGPGTSGSQPNFRNLQFGIDSGSAPKWNDCGRPGNTVYVMALAVHEGDLFAGTCEPGKSKGHVFRYGEGDQWIDCGSPDGSNAVTCLASYKGKLYAGTGRYRMGGSALTESENSTAGGKLFCYEGEKSWKDCGQLPGVDAIGGLLEFRGEFYATSMYHPSAMYRYEGGSEWLPCPLPKEGQRVSSPAVFNGSLYAITYDACAIYRFDGEKWSDIIKLEPRGQTYSLEVHAGELYVGTWPRGHVYRSADGQKWTDTGRLGHEEEVMAMAVHNGKLYGGSLPLAQVYRYDGGTTWTNTGQLDMTPAVRFRRAWSMAIHDGRLFCGLLPSGHVQALDAGANVSFDHELPSGWRHVTAVREGNHLNLFVDGKLVATSAAMDPSKFDLSNDEPLKIGFGGHDYFHGSMRDLRIYTRALASDEIKALANTR